MEIETQGNDKTAMTKTAWQDRLADIQLLVLDIDGVLTDGRLYYDAQGEALKVFHVQDGHGIKALLAQQIMVACITGRHSVINTRRTRELGIDPLIQGSQNKLEDLKTLLHGIQPRQPGLHQVAFMGDDLPDLPAMQAVALAFTVPQAHPDIQHMAHYCTRAPGGKGAVREVCDLLLASRHAT